MFPELNRLEAPFKEDLWKRLDATTAELMTEFPEKALKKDIEETSIRAW